MASLNNSNFGKFHVKMRAEVAMNKISLFESDFSFASTSSVVAYLSLSEFATTFCSFKTRRENRATSDAITQNLFSRARPLEEKKPAITSTTTNKGTPMAASDLSIATDEGTKKFDQEERLRRRLDLIALAMPGPALDSDAVDRADIAEIESRIHGGARTSVDSPRTRSIIDAVLGVDFGTSSTKIVARLPFAAGTTAVAIPVPQTAQSDGHPHLWRTCIWVAPDGSLSIAPKSGATRVDRLKTRIIANAGNALPDYEADELACGFLALQIQQARGWLLDRRADLFGRGPLRWWLNVGFPAESLDLPTLRARYEMIVAAAMDLSHERKRLTRQFVREALKAVAGSDKKRLADRNGFLFPEIAAAVAGYASSSKRKDGLFAMVDVGAATLDVCTFNLFPDQQGLLKCPIFEADVSLLGVEVWRHCNEDVELKRFFPDEVELRQRKVIWTTKKERYRLSDRWSSGLPIFLVGGGSLSDVHVEATSKISGWLAGQGCGGAAIENLPPPDELLFECAPGDVQRLAVAVGLSLFNTDIPQAKLPSEITNDAAPAVRESIGNYISKDMI